MKELFSSLVPTKGEKKAPKEQKFKDDAEKALAKDTATRALWETYKNFKKAHQMNAW